jgi:Xaa-Pro aminopeptidase
MGTLDRRLAALRDRLRELRTDALLVAPGSDLRYLTEYDALPLERPTLLIVTPDGPPRLVAPELERPRVEQEVHLSSVELHTYGEHDDALALAARLTMATDDATIAVGDQMWTSFTLGLQEALPGRRWIGASGIIAPLRAVKDADELARLAAVGRAIDAVHRRVPDVLAAGRTERAVARDIAAMIREEHDTVSFVIVAAGPNAASPHHEPGSRVIERGDAVVVDIGGVLDGYCSDMTRTYAVGVVPDGMAEAYVALQEAQAAGVRAVRPGMTAGSVDRAARSVLEQAGLGDAFVHRTGHGIGLDTHETPWIIEGSDVILEEGMAFSVEPGFYLAGRYGARIEDIVAVTSDGSVAFNQVDRDLAVV